ncbi:Hypothetical protein I595_1664 [Croceitalea dokdonensis DOKDO 023]|uniref:Uncharacterized protein n=1 Tax=Croceitalea dokdonensis DOKDO 023 TaxID=1300341 RepID=A0A0P7AVS1_9FLAO|nr:Hypothetical protein I595_1664 [Croceitalea dokdonensis DOKDO 023]
MTHQIQGKIKVELTAVYSIPNGLSCFSVNTNSAESTILAFNTNYG